MRTGEAAKALGVSPRTVRYWAQTGKLAASRPVDGHWHYDYSTIIDRQLLGNVSVSGQISLKWEMGIVRNVPGHAVTVTHRLGDIPFLQINEPKIFLGAVTPRDFKLIAPAALSGKLDVRWVGCVIAGTTPSPPSL